MCKKIDKASKKKDVEDLGEWKQSISNHMYWCASSTPDGHPQTMVEKWKILPQHIMNIHKNPDGKIIKKCNHGRLRGEARNRLWLKPGMLSYLS